MGEGSFAHEKLECDDAKRKNVRGRAGLLLLDTLRGHVARRTHVVLHFVVRAERDAEVGDLHPYGTVFGGESSEDLVPVTLRAETITQDVGDGLVGGSLIACLAIDGQDLVVGLPYHIRVVVVGCVVGGLDQTLDGVRVVLASGGVLRAQSVKIGGVSHRHVLEQLATRA